MTKPNALQMALESDLFIQSVSFNEENIQIDYIDETKQSEVAFLAETMILMVDGKEELEEAYFHLQELLQILVRDAHVARRLANE